MNEDSASSLDNDVMATPDVSVNINANFHPDSGHEADHMGADRVAFMEQSKRLRLCCEEHEDVHFQHIRS